MLSLSDIYPLSQFQRGAKAFLAKLKETKAPIVLTVNGKATAVVQDAESYQQILDKMELLESMVGIRKSIANGQPLPIQPRKDGKAKLYQIQQFFEYQESEEE